MSDQPPIPSSLIDRIANVIDVANEDIAMGMLPRGKDEARFIAEKVIAAMGDASTRKDEARELEPRTLVNLPDKFSQYILYGLRDEPEGKWFDLKANVTRNGDEISLVNLVVSEPDPVSSCEYSVNAMTSQEKAIASRDGTLPVGFYWVEVRDYSGGGWTIGKYRTAYSFDEDKRPFWDLCGDSKPRHDTENPDASNALRIGRFLGDSPHQEEMASSEYSDVPDRVAVGGYNFPISEIEKPYYARATAKTCEISDTVITELAIAAWNTRAMATEQPVEYSSATAARKAELDSLTAETMIKRLMEACNGHPHAKIPWPHYVLHDAAYFIGKQSLLKREVVAQDELAHFLQTKPGPISTSQYDAEMLLKYFDIRRRGSNSGEDL